MENSEAKESDEQLPVGSGAVGYVPDFTAEKCELFSIDFVENQITLTVSDELLRSGLHAGTLTIDFTPLQK